ncbi:MAG: PAS domain-containing protein, partial [Nannocystaceae bacterium]|nr:PAS domain-containing protein [Nannocystaceae bacterium]
MDSSRHPFAALVAAIPLPAGLVDAAGRLVLVNRAWGSCAAPGAVVQRVAGPEYFTHLEHSLAEGTAELHLAAVPAVQSRGAESGRTQADMDLFEPEPEASCVEVGGAMGGAVWCTRIAPAGDGLALVTHEDVSVRRRAQADLRKSRARLRTILTGAPLALFAVDADGVFSMVEGMAAGAAGLITPDVIGKKVDSEYRHIPDLVGAVRSAIDGATAVTTVEVGAMAFEVHCSPELDAAGRTIGAVGVATDVTERVRAQRLKDDFVSVVNHELRTPLTSIHGALSLLENGVAGELPDEAIELTSIARTSVDRLIRMISDLLDLDRLDSGRFELNRTRFDLAQLAADAARELSALATDAEVTIDHSRCLHAQVEADRDRVHQVLTNLLSNAIKFSNPGSQVTVSMSRIDGFVQVSVTDEGPGIRAEDRPRLFRKFSQLASAGDSSRRGSGLGLVISKSIVEAHGGRISLRSEVGAGSTFT